MAKRRRRTKAASSRRSVAEHRIEAFADDLGRLLGTARAKAEGWLGQREAIAKHLSDIRDTATGLLAQLTGARFGGSNARRKGGRAGSGQAGSTVGRRKKRRLSADARERIAEAQRRRWAKQKAAQK